MKQKVYRAGIVPYVIENGDVLMMFMIPSNAKYGGASPQMAKGKMEEGETSEETAVREGEEELGLVRTNILNLFHVGNFLGRTEVYAARILDKEDFDKFNFETKRTVWLTNSQFQQMGRELHKPVINEVVLQIKKKENI